MSTLLALAFLVLMVVWSAVLHGRLILRWDSRAPVCGSYALAAPRSLDFRIGRLFVGIIIAPAWR